ncbi:MAG: hypothetical protein JWM59_1528 [Verrucomicrobiales bacterium]|nr:hypothetical protein [Verrucomicrobiales bacterium]
MLLFLLPATAVLISCATMEPQRPPTSERFGPGYPAGSAGWSEKERGVYRAAFDAGRRDAREGYRYDDDRVTLPLADRLWSFSRRGYRAGFYHDRPLGSAARGRATQEAPADGLSIPGAGGSSVPDSTLQPLAPPVTAPPKVQAPARSTGPDPFSVPLESMGTEGEAR